MKESEKIANNSGVDCEPKTETPAMQEVAILHQALVAAREGDLQTLQVGIYALLLFCEKVLKVV